MTYPTFEQVYAKAPQLLWKTQKSYEMVCREIVNLYKEYGDAKAAYEATFACNVNKTKGEGKVPVTLIKEVAKNLSHQEYKAFITKEYELKAKQMEEKYLENRLNSIKFIGRVDTGNVN